jgi:hypothetical protein
VSERRRSEVGAVTKPLTDPSQQAAPERGGSGSSANIGHASDVAGQTRLVTDVETAIRHNLSIAQKFIGPCRQADGLRFSPYYNSEDFLAGLADAQKHFETAEKNHVVLHGTSLEARRHAAGITAALLGRFIEPGKSLHRLILNVLRDILDGDENSPTTDIAGEYECRLYAASLESANDVIHVLQRHEDGQNG